MKRGPSPNDLPPGTLIGAFEILAPLGRGGMGAVYQARNRITGDVRALKLILPELAASAEFVDRFVREIRLAMAVEHPNLVRVFEPGMDGELIFLPMELLQGEPLGARIHRDRVVTVEAAIALVQSIGSALSALHARGILHRDVKPSNVFLAQDGANVVPKLLDLGAGKEVGASDELTSTGLAIGSPHYMAPEQAAGQKNVDARIDQYALAVLTYQLLTGARPYENDDTGHVLAKVLSGAPYRTPRAIRADISPETEAAVLRGMSRNRDDRFSSIDEFVAALSPVPWNGRPLAGPPTPASVEIEDSIRYAPKARGSGPALFDRASGPGAFDGAGLPDRSSGPQLPTQERSGTMKVAVDARASSSSSPLSALGAMALVIGLLVIGGAAFHKLRSGSSASATAQAAASVAPSAIPSTQPAAPVETAAQQPVTVAAPPDTTPPVATPPQRAVGASTPTAAPTKPVPARAPAPPRPRAQQAPSGGTEPCHATPGAPCL